MKSMIGLSLLCTTAVAAGPVQSQKATDRTERLPGNQRIEPRLHAISFQNPYTGAAVRAELALPGRVRPLSTMVLTTGAGAREQAASEQFARYFIERGYAVLTLPPIAAGGATKEDSLNTVASLRYLETKQELRGAPIGLVGYGQGVRLAATAASQGHPASYLILMGGEVLPDKLNAVPSTLKPGTLPKEEAVQSLARVNCPVLILMGEYDRQGTHRSAAANAESLKSALDAGKHKNYTIKVMIDSDDMLAETRAGGGGQSDTALPPPSVWKFALDWTSKQLKGLDSNAGSDDIEAASGKPIRIYPKSVYGPFSYRPEMIWAPVIGGQTRPFGYWYW